MRLRRELSRGDEKALRLADSLVQHARDRAQLQDLAFALWPRLCIYEGQTHLRLIPSGRSQEESFYVD